MGAHCNHDHSHGNPASPAYRRVLWVGLVVNAAMFLVELATSWQADSLALLADSADFFADAANFAVSLAVLGAAAHFRSRAAWVKGLTMGLIGTAVLAKAVWAVVHGAAPQPVTMGVVGALALAANFSVAVLLYAWREGDANMRSVWLCTRNDAIGNVAVLLAALGVAGTGTPWPDLAVAAVMASLSLHSAREIMRHAAQELHNAGHAAHEPHDHHGDHGPACQHDHGHRHPGHHDHAPARRQS